ncbi:MAG: hypothetical protein WBL19_01910 [Minisyncoccia bacterium]
MNRFFTIIAAVLVSGCTGLGYTTVPTVPSSTQYEVKPVWFLQRGVNAQVINFCSSRAVLYPTYPFPTNGEAIELPPGQPVWVAMAPNLLEMSRGLAATVVFYEKGIQMGTVSRSFRIDQYSTQRVQWILGGDRGGGGQNVFVDRCPRSLDRSR